MDHLEPYPDGYIADILNSVQSIAVVGASPRENRPSHRIMQTLISTGYDVYPVNPHANGTILGRPVFAALSDISVPVDMVDVFRKSEALLGVARESVQINAKVLWSQLGVFDADAAGLAEAAGMLVVMNRCPRIELARLIKD